MSGYPQPELDPKVLSIFENGHSFHNRMEHLFGKAGILIAPELPIKNAEMNISGRTDAVVRNPNKGLYKDTHLITLLDFDNNIIFEGPNNEVALVELKSINNKGFNKVNNDNHPKEEHIQQLQLYMFLSGIRQGVVFYENKDTQATAEFWIEYDEKLVEKLIAKIKNINTHVAAKTLPEREGTRSSYKCNYCDFKDICWNDNLVIPSLDDII
jgi:CRISPR/Cas system-associated exonuclease Cas4 (RecB family)